MLLVAGVAVSGVAWGFWHYLGRDAMDVMSTLAIVLLAGDNVRLRRG
jgi:hypothetical protein